MRLSSGFDSLHSLRHLCMTSQIHKRKYNPKLELFVLSVAFIVMGGLLVFDPKQFYFARNLLCIVN